MNEDTRHKINVGPNEKDTEKPITIDTADKRIIHKRHNTTTVRHQSSTPEEEKDDANV